MAKNFKFIISAKKTQLDLRLVAVGSHIRSEAGCCKNLNILESNQDTNLLESDLLVNNQHPIMPSGMLNNNKSKYGYDSG